MTPKLEILSKPAKGTAHPTKLLFVHGICVGAWIWEEYFFQYFTDAGFDCYAVSLRGHGKSEGHERLSHYRLSDYTEDLRHAVSQIGEPLAVIGHSLGGAVIQDWLRIGGKAKGVALLASVPPWGLSPSSLRMAVTNMVLFQELAKLNSLGPDAANPSILKQGLFSADVSLEEYQKFMKKSQGESPIIGMELQGMRPFAPIPWFAPPIFVLGAEDDQLISVNEVRRTAFYYGTTPHIIPKLSHAVMVDKNWEDAAKALRNWLEKSV